MGCSTSKSLSGRRARKPFDVLPHVFELRYKLLRKIGEGGFSIIKLGICELTLSKVAVKIISRKNLVSDGELYLRREVEIQKSLDHPNVVKCIDFFEEKEYFYVVMEYVAGGELFDRIVQRTSYNENDARQLVHTLLLAVKYCHDNGVVHRDIKPENLLMTSKSDDAVVKLADFGFAVVDNGSNSLITACGTPAYIAPEILKRERYGAAVDMWAVGVVAFILLGGYQPFRNEDEHIQRNLIKSGNYTFDPKRFSTVSDKAKDLISKLLVVEPQDRLTAQTALKHPWMLVGRSELEARPLDENLVELQVQIKNKKFKAAAHTIIAIGRMRSFAANHSYGFVPQHSSDTSSFVDLDSDRPTVYIAQSDEIRETSPADSNELVSNTAAVDLFVSESTLQ